MKKELLTFKDPKSPISEIFRSLRTNIQFMCSDKDLKTILITSTVSGEGKSLVTANLAITFAQAGKKVILVDADMRKGRQHQIFNILQKPGLSNYLSNIIEKAEDAKPKSKNTKELDIYIKSTDIEIIEAHHNRKIDSPSGTAQMFADTINEALGGDYHCEYNRHAKHEKRDKKEIGMSSIRGGNIVGEHTVKFFGDSETFEITHTSYSRNVFAEGAIKATEFIVNKPNGFYNMDDLVK